MEKERENYDFEVIDETFYKYNIVMESVRVDQDNLSTSRSDEEFSQLYNGITQSCRILFIQTHQNSNKSSFPSKFYSK